MSGNLTPEQIGEIDLHWEDLLSAEWHETNRKPFEEHRKMCRWFFEMGFAAGFDRNAAPREIPPGRDECLD